MTKRKIGIVDHSLDNFHANTFLSLMREDLKPRGWEIARCWAVNGDEGRVWAKKNEVSYAEEFTDLGECDAFMILAPSNPEVHPEMAKRLFPFGKVTYVDKTFAPNYETAKEIFTLADKYNVPVMTTSALRCATSLKRVVEKFGSGRILHMQAWGGGGSFEEYAIHPLEMVIFAMGAQVEEVMHVASDKDHHALHLQFGDKRSASIFIHTNNECPFRAMVTTEEQTVCADCSADPIFRDLCNVILDFFESGEPSVDRSESLMIRRVLDVVNGSSCDRRFTNVKM